MDKKRMDKGTLRGIILIAVFLLLTGAITWALMPYIDKLSVPEYQAQLKVWVEMMGVKGWVIVFGIQVIQIVIAFIPGEPVEILSGVLYGTWGGLLLCLFGCIVASALVFLLSRRFGTKFLHKIFTKEKIDSFSFLKDNKQIETVAFILFLIPGTPKDMLTYVAGVSSLKLSSFLLITTFARIPSIISSTMVGETVRQGNWTATIIIFVVTAVIGLVGIRYKDRLMDYCRKLGKQE